MLVGKKAIITGGSRGIGFAIASAFLQHGVHVEIWGTNEKRGMTAIEELSTLGQVQFACVDVSNLDAVAEASQAFLSAHGAVDILVNNAGITRDNLLMRMSQEEWTSVINTNLSSLYHVCSALIRPMVKARSGAIINISSVVGLIGSSGQTNYAAAKAGIIGFSKALAKEVASRQVRVNCIAPGFVDTDMTRVLNDQLKSEWLKGIPMGRMGMPDEIAQVAVFLASPLSSYMTGQVLCVDGGLT